MCAGKFVMLPMRRSISLERPSILCGVSGGKVTFDEVRWRFVISARLRVRQNTGVVMC